MTYASPDPIPFDSTIIHNTIPYPMFPTLRNALRPPLIPLQNLNPSTASPTAPTKPSERSKS